MQIVPCPSCGAQLQFRSPASVMAVCEYCQTTVLKDADSVKDLGKMSALLEDYSPLQIGSSGIFGGNAFTVIGRIQLRYAEGMWNEWYLLFNDGKPAWLGDASGQYMLTTEIQNDDQIPAFTDLIPARSYAIHGQRYMAADVRTADCIGGQGELPFKVGTGWQAKVADFRSGRNFLTLDYSDPAHTKIFAGQVVTLDEMQCQLLREDDQIQAGSSKFKGKVAPLLCPSCGSSCAFLPGVTSTLLCPSCHAQVDTTGSTAQVLAAGKSVAQVYTTLQLGAEANISGRPFQIIGLMKCVDNENTIWTEYLLHSPRAGFLWLIETEHSWARASVLDEWPSWIQEDTATLSGTAFHKLYRYPARVIFAIGAFNWRVNVGYQTEVVEFQSGQNTLAAEMTAAEITWSQSTPVNADQIHAWFGDKIVVSKSAEAVPLKTASIKYCILLFLLNLIPLVHSEDALIYVVIGCVAIYYPAKYLDSLNEE